MLTLGRIYNREGQYAGSVMSSHLAIPSIYRFGLIIVTTRKVSRKILHTTHVYLTIAARTVTGGICDETTTHKIEYPRPNRYFS